MCGILSEIISLLITAHLKPNWIMRHNVLRLQAAEYYVDKSSVTSKVQAQAQVAADPWLFLR